MVKKFLYKIPFNKPCLLNKFNKNLDKKLFSTKTSGRGPYTLKVEKYLENLYGKKNTKIYLTTSCTHALEASAIMLNLKKDDEVIVPSYTFVSTALSFMMHGAKIKFCDIRSDNMNIDQDAIEKLITKKTRAIVVVHYGGFACDMDSIIKIAKKHKIFVIEDNAHGLFGKYKNKHLGTIGDFSTLSFHETKNISCGEGGALIINNKKFQSRAKLIIEKGTNRIDFSEGYLKKYSWVDKGSSYIPSDILAAVLYNQLKTHKKIQEKRLKIWNLYYKKLKDWAILNGIQMPKLDQNSIHTGHLFFLIFPTTQKKEKAIIAMKKKKIQLATHYLPLHKSTYYLKNSDKKPILRNSEKLSKRIVRLPIYYNLKNSEQNKIIKNILEHNV